MRKFLFLIFMSSLGFGGCKNDTPEILFNEQLEGKEFLMYFNAALDYSIEFYKPGEFRYITKNRPSGTVNEYDEYRYFKWVKEGPVGLSIEVIIPADSNFPERKIKGIVTED